jgi:hypothetical protein
MSYVCPGPRGGRARIRRSRRGRGMAAAVLLGLAASVAALAGCGSGGSATTAAQPNAQSTTATRQIMTKVQRGDVVETAFGRLELADATAKPKATVQLTGDAASKVAAGQTLTAMVGGVRQGAGQPSGAPSPAPTGSAGNGGQPSPPSQGGGQVAPGDPSMGGGQGMPGGGFAGAGGVDGTVLSVETGTDGSVTAVVRLDSLPKGAQSGDQGMAVIQIEVLAQDVLVVPTQAIKKSGGTSTVTVISGGNSEQREVETGAAGTASTEIVSGLNEGDSIVYEVKFPGMAGGQNGASGAMGSPPPGGQTQE